MPRSTTASKSSVNDWLMQTHCDAPAQSSPLPTATMLVRCKFKVCRFDRWRFRCRPPPPPSSTVDSAPHHPKSIHCERTTGRSLIVLVTVLSAFLLATCNASEFPERECCDPIYPSLPDSVPSESDADVTTDDVGGDVGGEAGGVTGPPFPGASGVDGLPGKWNVLCTRSLRSIYSQKIKAQGTIKVMRWDCFWLNSFFVHSLNIQFAQYLNRNMARTKKHKPSRADSLGKGSAQYLYVQIVIVRFQHAIIALRCVSNFLIPQPRACMPFSESALNNKPSELRYNKAACIIHCVYTQHHTLDLRARHMPGDTYYTYTDTDLHTQPSTLIYYIWLVVRPINECECVCVCVKVALSQREIFPCSSGTHFTCAI